MRNLKTLVVCTALAVTPIQANAQLADIWNGVTDIARIWTDKYPEPAGNFTYSNEDYFDVKLHRSLKKNWHNVRVNLPGDGVEPEAMPERVERWLIETDKKGGKVQICATGGGDMPWDWFAQIALKWAKDYVTYRPVKNYDAFVMTNDDGYISQVNFFHKRSDRERPSSCRNYFVSDRV